MLKTLFSKRKKEVNIDIYNTLADIPFYNWQKMYSEKNLGYLIVNKENRIFENNPSLTLRLENAWQSIYDEYLKDFGLNDKMERVLELERQIGLLLCDLWIEDNKFLRNKIRILQKKLDREKSLTEDDGESGSTYERQTVMIEKWLQSSIDTKEISARKYFTYIALIGEEAEKYKMRKAQRENGKD